MKITIREMIADVVTLLFMLVGAVLIGIGAFGADTDLNSNLEDIGDIVFTGTLVVALHVEKKRLAKARREYWTGK